MIKRMTANARKPGGFWGSLMIKKMNAGHFEMTKWALSKLTLPENGVVADLGCGGGRCIKLLSQMCNARICGIDYSPLCVKKASRKNRRAIKNGRVAIFEASVDALPFENNSIDCAVAVESIYFWNNPDKAFSEIKRVLKPNGSLNIICEMVKNDDGSGAHTEVAELLKLNYYSKSEI
ncbi:MAG: class I SAM-dependent methyltransferase, partial [Acutalibacteraceae bacterium]